MPSSDLSGLCLYFPFLALALAHWVKLVTSSSSQSSAPLLPCDLGLLSPETHWLEIWRKGEKRDGCICSPSPHLFPLTLWYSLVGDQTPELHGLPHSAVTSFWVVQKIMEIFIVINSRALNHRCCHFKLINKRVKKHLHQNGPLPVWNVPPVFLGFLMDNYTLNFMHWQCVQCLLVNKKLQRAILKSFFYICYEYLFKINNCFIWLLYGQIYGFNSNIDTHYLL